MKFLVEIEVDMPVELRDPRSERRRELLEAELRRGLELRWAGTIESIWRVPGQLRNVGIWEAEDATELDALIASLPLATYLRADVTPLALHPIERELAR